MLFNSIDFAVFLPLVFLLYQLLQKRSLRLQNAFLLVASYFFYGCWDWRFLFLIIFSSCVDFWVGNSLATTAEPALRKKLLGISLGVNLGLLGVFKYFDFFSESLVASVSFFGLQLEDPFLLNIVLPVGISFYTFQTLSYSIDIYRKKIEPTQDVIAFFTFVAFFPQLVAGPIERAAHLLPQFTKPRTLSYDQTVDGLRIFLWGLVKKIVIADTCAIYVNDIFANYPNYSGSTLLLGAVLFSFQIYGDFSGYSDMAVGISRMLGFDLMQNFRTPYFSRNIAEFWKRWHISLSTWFRDYLYIPLGGSRDGKVATVRNIFVVFLVSGFWHGANWTFVFWGLVHALLFLPLILMGQNLKDKTTLGQGSKFRAVCEVLATFIVVSLAWVFFRSESILHAFNFLSHMIAPSLLNAFSISLTEPLVLVGLFILIEWTRRNSDHVLAFSPSRSKRWHRWSSYYSLCLVLLWYGGQPEEFIYFQF